MSLNLPALADLEWLLRPDGEPLSFDEAGERGLGQRIVVAEGVDPATARRRADDRREFRRLLALRWLGAMRERRGDLPGEWIGRGLSLAGWILVILGLLLGGAAASVFLSYDGSVPVNVLPFVAFFFLLQIVLLLALLAFVASARMPGRGPGLLHRPIAWLAQRFGGRGHDAVAVLRVLHARRGLYVDVERWSLFTLAQRFGIAFNVGALLTALHAIVFTDLVFSWSTTLALDAHTVHAAVQALALPWSWYPEAVPSLDVVTASQWARMPGKFVGGTSPESALELAAEWWRFLIAGLIVYGLLPRLVAWLVGQWCSHRALAAVGFDHAGYQELFDRLLPRGSGWQSPRPGDVTGPAPVSGRAPATPHAPVVPDAVTGVVVWGSLSRHRAALAEAVAGRFGAAPRGLVLAGGAALEADDRAIAELAALGPARVVLVVAAGHQPTADVLGFLRRLRAALATKITMVVGLLDIGADGAMRDADEGERDAWRRALAPLDDPYLWVEAMGGAQ